MSPPRSVLPLHPLLADLNEAQRDAVSAAGGRILVLAGAGSGKTRVITRRIAWLMAHGVEPWRILALTFTNKAAGEMRERVLRAGGAGGALIATFHAACARFLRIDGGALGFDRDFSIFDTDDRDRLLRDLLREAKIDDREVRPADVGARISRLKNQRLTPDDLPSAHSAVDNAVDAVFGPYHERMREQDAMDFDDLLLKVLELLEVSPDHRERYRRRYTHVLVDEYQDTNRVQYLLLRQLVPDEGNLMVVGDPDQSIYRFRGAEPSNILDFERDFRDVRVIRLETNYRSTANICAAADAVIANNKKRKPKRLITDNAPGDKVCVLECISAQREAMEVVAQCRTLRQRDPRASIAVFFRTHFLSRTLEEVFRREAVPYVIVGGTSFYERREIKDLLAYLRAAVNRRDDVSLARILNVPNRGIGRVTEERLVAHARAAHVPLADCLATAANVTGVGAKAGKALQELASLLEAVRAAGAGSAGEALHAVLERTGYVEWLTGLGDADDVDREQNIGELISDVELFDREASARGPVGNGQPDDEPVASGRLMAYLARVSLTTSDDRTDGAPSDNAVTFMTLHSAKGLEFDHVFLVGMEEGLFPHVRTLESEADQEEERRLFYVGLTRARQRLFLLHSLYRQTHGREQPQMKSSFLREIPEELIEQPEDERDPFGDGAPVAVPGGSQDGLREGDVVMHKTFGRGRLVRLAGSGVNRKATVLFSGQGERTLLLEMAGLVKVEEG